MKIEIPTYSELLSLIHADIHDLGYAEYMCYGVDLCVTKENTPAEIAWHLHDFLNKVKLQQQKVGA